MAITAQPLFSPNILQDTGDLLPHCGPNKKDLWSKLGGTQNTAALLVIWVTMPI